MFADAVGLVPRQCLSSFSPRPRCILLAGAGTTDRAGFVVTSSSCTNAVDDVANIAQGVHVSSANCATTGSGHSCEVPVLAVDLPKGGQWKVCYCTSYDSCNEDSDFTVEAGVLTVAGARGTGNFVCWKLTPQCVVSVDGTSLLGSDHARSRRALALTVSILSTR